MVSRLDRNRPNTTRFASGAGTHLLGENETFDELAERFGLEGETREDFRRLNPRLADGTAIPGETITIPPNRPVSAPPPAAPRSRIETSWTEGYRRRIGGQNRFNGPLEAATKRWADLDPLILKSMLAQESGFEPSARNVYGYAGIAQLGVAEARSQGLATASSRMRNQKQGISAHVDARDERLDPEKAIPAAAGLMRQKAAVLDRGARVRGVDCPGFDTLGRPEGDDYWRFVAASYNAGEGTVLTALRLAYGDKPPRQVRWNDLVAAPGGDPRRSPLYRALAAVGLNPATKYREVTEYARDVVSRARQ